MFNIILFGPPGSGKGTQAKLMTQRYSLKHISTGDLLRSEIANETELGQKAQTFMDKGELVPDEVVIGMIDSTIENNPDIKGFVFDGFPRTIPQAEALDNLLSGKGHPIVKVLSLKVEDEEIVKRLKKRAEDEDREDDKDEDTVRNRITVYKNQTEPVAEHYRNQYKLVEIPGEGDVDSTCLLILTELDKII